MSDILACRDGGKEVGHQQGHRGEKSALIARILGVSSLETIETAKVVNSKLTFCTQKSNKRWDIESKGCGIYTGQNLGQVRSPSASGVSTTP